MFKLLCKLFKKEDEKEQQPIIDKEYKGYSNTFFMPNKGFAFKCGGSVAKDYLIDTIIEYLKFKGKIELDKPDIEIKEIDSRGFYESISIEIKSEDLKIDTYRASGAGGQHINTTDSAVRITHIPTNIVVTCQKERSQIKNRETAMKILKSKLFEMELEKREKEMEDLKGTDSKIEWGSQIRSYVFQPYQLVKDHRTNYEIGNVQSVMDGNITGFLHEYLILKKNNKI